MKKVKLKTLFLLVVFLWNAIRALPAFASDVIDYCPWHYSDIDTVFWNTQSKIPSSVVGTDWSDVENNVATYFDRLIKSHSHIPVVKTSDSVEQILSAHPKSLYINVVFSYAPKESFTTPLVDDALVMWIETTRNEPNQDQSGLTPIKKVSRSDLALASKDHAYFQGKLVTFASPFFMLPDVLLTQVSCDVLKFNTDSICIHPPSSGQTNIVQQTSAPCVKVPEQIHGGVKQ